MKRSSLHDRRCPIARGAAELVDAWSFLILRELFLGNRRFESIRRQTSMSPRSLTLRLEWLQQQGIVERQTDAQTGAAQGYRLTDKGLDLWPVMMLLRQWGERWGEGSARQAGLGEAMSADVGAHEQGSAAAQAVQEPTPPAIWHRGHQHKLTIGLVCTECGEPVNARSGEILVGERVARNP